jgi:2,3-bisphosphoglycerate-independent phosphoglycerate mutase
MHLPLPRQTALKALLLCQTRKKVILVIMDGWGLGRQPAADAIQHARVPFVSSACTPRYPNTTLVTYGEDVGLPEGQMGNSEVGHLNLGAGRIVNQELQRINVAIRDGSFSDATRYLLAAIRGARTAAHRPLAPARPWSVTAGYTPISRHLMAIVDTCARKRDLKDVFIHAFTDGRDTDPRSGLGLRPGTAGLTSIRQYRQHRHRQRPLLCHGPGQALGAGPAGL